MKQTILHIIFLISVSLLSFSQEKPIKGYTIEDEYIVFTFDKRDYDKGTHHRSQERLDFEDFDIKNVVVAGNFNNWSRKNWKMKKVDENIYQLKKKISDFKDDFNWEFKFVVNNSFWAEPNKRASNITPAKSWYGKNYGTYNLKILPAFISEKGNTTFTLKGYKNANKVVVSGSFNKWDEEIYTMNKTADGWQLTLQLKPNTYQYKFIVDGNWILDPENENKVENEFHGHNSVVEVKKETTFLLEYYEEAEEVILSGSFNNWSESDYKMIKTKKGWSYTTQLSGGKHHYKFIVDGKWILDPENPIREFDWNGHVNSVKMVK